VIQRNFASTEQKKETSTIENGRELYLDTYKEIVAAKLPELFEVKPEIATEVLVYIINSLNVLLDQRKFSSNIPPFGVTGEVLTKIALESKGIKAEPSTLVEDVTEGYDFTILGRKIDITTSHLDTTFIKKYTAGHPVTLYVPTCPFDEVRNTENRMNFYNENTYGYKLIYENTFDVDQYLKETFYQTNNVLKILYKHYNDTLNNGDTVNDSNFGTITPQLLINYEDFLNDLALEIYTPLDNN
jgi:hypothetical protein